MHPKTFELMPKRFNKEAALVKVLVSKNIFTPKYDLLIPKRIIVSGPHKGNFYKTNRNISHLTQCLKYSMDCLKVISFGIVFTP